jgi:hypothetical protein
MAYGSASRGELARRTILRDALLYAMSICALAALAVATSVFRLQASDFGLPTFGHPFGRTKPYSRIFRYNVFDEMPSKLAALP